MSTLDLSGRRIVGAAALYVPVVVTDRDGGPVFDHHLTIKMIK